MVDQAIPSKTEKIAVFSGGIMLLIESKNEFSLPTIANSVEPSSKLGFTQAEIVSWFRSSFKSVCVIVIKSSSV